MRRTAIHALLVAVCFSVFASLATPAGAQDACKSRGDLDTQYCDENNDLVSMSMVSGFSSDLRFDEEIRSFSLLSAFPMTES